MMTISPDIEYWTLEWLPIIMSPSTVILFVSILVLSGTRRFFRICSGSGIFSLSEKTLSCIRSQFSGMVFGIHFLNYNIKI